MEKHTDYAKIEKQARIRSRVRSTAVHILLSLWAVIVLFPFYWMVLTSVKSYGSYTVKAKLGYEISGSINVLVVEG